MLRSKRKKQSASVLVSKLLEDISLNEEAEQAEQAKKEPEDGTKLDRKNFRAWMNNAKPRKGMSVARKKNGDQPIDTRCLLTM